MKYALRIVREVGTRNITVYPVKPCRSDQKPYHTRTSGVCVEVLRVFDTKEAATVMEKIYCVHAAPDRLGCENYSTPEKPLKIYIVQ